MFRHPHFDRRCFDAVFRTESGVNTDECGGGPIRAVPRASIALPVRLPVYDVLASLRPKVGRDRAHLERIAALVTNSAVRVREIKVNVLSGAAAAHKVSEGRRLRGKLVFKVR